MELYCGSRLGISLSMFNFYPEILPDFFLKILAKISEMIKKLVQNKIST